MRYFTVMPEDLEAARPGLELLSRLFDDDSRFAPYLYGVTSKETILLAVGEAIERDMDEESGEKAPSVNEVALAIPFSSDTLYNLTGSGLNLRNEEFAYRAGRDNVRTQWLYARNGVNVNLRDFDTIALSDEDAYLDDFLQEYGVNTGAVGADITIPRSQPAVLAESQRSVASLQRKRAAQRHQSVNPIDFFLR